MEKRTNNKAAAYTLLILILIAALGLGGLFYSRYLSEQEERQLINDTLAAAKEANVLVIDGTTYTPDKATYTGSFVRMPDPLSEEGGDKAPLTVSDFSAVAADLQSTPATVQVTLLQGGATATEGDASALADFRSLGGEYTLEVNLQFPVVEAHTKDGEKLGELKTESFFSFPVQYAPPLAFLNEPAEKPFLQGDVLLLHATGMGQAIIETNLPSELKFYENETQYTTLIPFAYTLEPGDYFVKLTKGAENVSYHFSVASRTFVQQHITVSDDVSDSTVNNAAANKEFSDVMNPAKALSDPTLYITKPFIAPLKGRISTQFGMQRFVNNAKNPTRHSGIDIAGNKTGTPIVAANRGRVIVSQMLALTGNTVVIEHGFGLKSIYYHMDELSVKVDDMVEQGAQVGTVGNTGFSTGPHLHFSMCINQTWIKPLYDYGVQNDK